MYQWLLKFKIFVTLIIDCCFQSKYKYRNINYNNFYYSRNTNFNLHRVLSLIISIQIIPLSAFIQVSQCYWIHSWSQQTCLVQRLSFILQKFDTWHYTQPFLYIGDFWKHVYWWPREVIFVARKNWLVSFMLKTCTFDFRHEHCKWTSWKLLARRLTIGAFRLKTYLT